MAHGDMALRIKELRKARNMTLEEVAKIVGVGKSTVRKWETGMIENMKTDKIVALAKALGTNPISLLGLDDYIDKDDAEFVASLGYLHPKEELPPEIEAVNTLLNSHGLYIMKTHGEYYFDEAGQVTEEELNDFLNTITTMVNSAADAFIKKKLQQNMRDFFNKE